MSSSVITPSSEAHMVSSGGDVADPCGEIEHSPSVTSQKSKEERNSGVYVLQSDQGSISAITREDALQTPESSVHVAHSGQIGNSSFAIRERVLDDGYNWRKYGQKNVKGNEYVRSYYRCTHPGCQVKKQLDCSSDGKVSDTVSFGHHNHSKPQQNLPLAAGFSVAIVEGKPNDQSSIKPAGKPPGQLHQPPRLIELPAKRDPPIAESFKMKDIDASRAESTRIRDEADNGDDPDTKRQKKSICIAEATPVNKHVDEHRAVVKTVSEVDILNDGYRWRKYGQKMVKGSPHPRSYYRCSNSGCPVKKHVERASHDPKVVVTTYEGTHDHDMPASRTVAPKASGLNTPPTSHTGKTGSKSDECDAYSLSKTGHSLLSPEIRIVKPDNEKSVTKPEDTGGLGSGIISSSSGHGIRPNEDQTELPGAESKPDEQESGISSEKGKVVGSKTSAQSSAALDSRLSGQLNDESREVDEVNIVSVVRPDIEGNCSEQQRANSEAIKS